MDKRPRGRPPDGSSPRDLRLEIRVSQEERDELVRAAGEFDLGSWVRSAALKAARRRP